MVYTKGAGIARSRGKGMDQEEQKRLEQASIAAHQIQAPISTLQTILRTLLGGFAGELTPKQKKILEAANRKAGDAMETVRGLLALSEAVRTAPHEATDAAAAVRKAQGRYARVASERGIELAVEMEVEEAHVTAEPAALTEAVTALVDNALKYTPEGGRVRVRLSVRASQSGTDVRLEVADSGIGIPEAEQPNLFRPFFRASNARKMVPGGTGLGLPFVQAVVAAAGGEIAVDRGPLGGAQFTLTMPWVPAPENAGAAAARQEPTMRVVVVGGVAAGPKVASKIMRLQPDAEVTIVEKGRVLSYAGCGLPYYIAGIVKDQRALASAPDGAVRGPEYFERVKNVRVMNRTEALDIDRARRTVRVRDLVSGHVSHLPYDKLVLATGAVPVLPHVPGVHLRNVFTLHGLENAEGIRANLAEGRAKDVTIVGGGLIGVEMTESLVSAGCRVTLVEMMPQVLTFLDWEMAELVRRHFESKGVRVMVGTRVLGFEGDDSVHRVLTDQGVLNTDMVILGVGVRPNVELARRAGLEIGPTGAVKVDDHMRTSDPDVYAAGDCVECADLLTGEPAYMPLGSTASKQGRVAAVNICGGDDAFGGVTSTTVCRVFDYTVARAGLSERQARERDVDVVCAVVPAIDRAHFMPAANLVVLKVVVDRAGARLLGVQAVGPGEAAKRCDVAVAAMTARMTVHQIANLDLCYAPPYSQAMDNLHTACNVARNKLAGHLVGLSPMQVKAKRDAGEDFILLDVRTHDEYEEGRIEGCLHVPLSTLRARLGEVPHDKEIVCVCRFGLRSYEASVILRGRGFPDVKIMDGGLHMWPYELIGG